MEEAREKLEDAAATRAWWASWFRRGCPTRASLAADEDERDS